jgi:hypothetical protein
MGGIITAPQLVTVTFLGDPLADQLQTFGNAVEGSQWWTDVTSGYCEGDAGACIGVGAPAVSVRYPTAPAKVYTDTSLPEPTTKHPSSLRAWLADAINNGDLPAPEPPPAQSNISNTLYLLYFPLSTTILLDGQGGCFNAEGYHGSMEIDGEQVAYAVISECPGAGMGTPPITTLQGTTITASHEIVEAATDPSDLAFGYYLNINDTSTWGWSDVEFGGEVADICVDPFGFDQDEWTEGGFTYQRIWSNPQAAAGTDPCAPLIPNFAYFNAAPAQSFFVLDVGSSVTFEVDAFSSAPREDWTLAVQDWDYAKNTYLTFAIAGGTPTKDFGDVIAVNNGSKVLVTMTLTRDPADLYTYEADGAVVSFTGNLTGAPASYWPFTVVTPAIAKSDQVDASLTVSSQRARRKVFKRPSASLELIPGLTRLARGSSHP